MRQATIGALAVFVCATLPTSAMGSAEAVRRQMEAIAVAIDGLGQWDRAAELRGTMEAIPDAELEQIYGGADLTVLIEAMGHLGGSRAEAQARVAAAREELAAAGFPGADRVASDPQRILGVDAPNPTASPFPEANYPKAIELCPKHGISGLDPPWRSDTYTELKQQANLNIAMGVFEEALIVVDLAGGIWAAASRGCDQDIIALFGGNTSLVCIVVDIVVAAVEFALEEARWGIEIAQANVDLMAACDAAVDSAESGGIYNRIGAVHGELERYKSSLEERLKILEANLDLALQVLLERDIQRGSGGPLACNVNELLPEVCAAAKEAIDRTKEIYNGVSPRAESKLAEANRLLNPVPPRELTQEEKLEAHNLCRAAYSLATKR